MAARDQHGPDAPWGDFQVVGRRNRKVDAMAKATGEAVYTDDIQLPGMLHAKMLRSPHAHARVLSIDTSKAEALAGVHGVLVGAELPVKYGVIPWTQDENALATDKVRFIGDEVAAVAAIDEDTALEALELIEVEYQVLDAILDPQDALTRTEPQVHEGRKRQDNVSKHVLLEFGDV
jgi:CO/xanthine dehydrogenase Mo-binding subunit